MAQKEEAEIKIIEEYLPAAASEDDIRRVRVIQFLTRQKGVNLAGVKYVLRLLQSLGRQGLDVNQVRELDTLQEVSGSGLSA